MVLGLGLIGAGTFMGADEWITYERYRRGVDKQFVTLPATERRPMGFAAERPATKAEIAVEKRRRAQKKGYADRQGKFMTRPEYQDAQMIASTLELMDVDNNPLDKFTPDEWRLLRETICGR